MASNNAIKIVIMGQGGVGKTAMVNRFVSGTFVPGYQPTIDDMFTKDIERHGAPRCIEISDTPGQEHYADLRTPKMSTGDGYLLVYSITDDATFKYLTEGEGGGLRARIVEALASKGRKNVPIFLVGTKKDLGDDRAVVKSERVKVAKAWDSKSFEVSAKLTPEEGGGVTEVFEAIVDAVLSVNTDPTKGGGGGSVLGAGRTASSTPGAPEKKKSRCVLV